VTLNQAGQRVMTSGTSYAAPHVTAIAGLLLSFDSTLTVPELRNLIVQGARRRNRQVAGKPVVNAYESLKLAAERPGAPLCGNQMWTTGENIVVQRGSTTETIVSIGGGIDRKNVDVLHGGRVMRVNVQDGWGRDYERRYAYDPASGRWTQRGPQVEGWTSRVPESGGTYLSQVLRSHDSDTLITFSEWNEPGSIAALQIRVRSPQGSKEIWIREPYAPPTLKWTCSYKWEESLHTSPDENCAGTGVNTYPSGYPLRTETPGWRVAYSPTGGELIVAFIRNVVEAAYPSEWTPCPLLPGESYPSTLYCRRAYRTARYLDTKVHTVRISDGGIVRTVTIPSAHVFRLALDESGTEMMTQHRSGTTSDVMLWEISGSHRRSYWQRTEDRNTCEVRVFHVQTGQPLMQSALRDCQRDPGLFVSPSLAPTRPPAIVTRQNPLSARRP